ncbi:MAG TPA: hypothetical protein VF388_11060 [Lacunisphaera sp.]
MKRLVWLLLAVFSTAIAQVQPTDVPQAPAEKCCCCCDKQKACDMPDCVPAPAGVQRALPQQTRVEIIGKRAAATTQTIREKFYVRVVPSIRVVPVLPVSAVVPPAASVPLFAAHCSFLI